MNIVKFIYSLYLKHLLIKTLSMTPYYKFDKEKNAHYYMDIHFTIKVTRKGLQLKVLKREEFFYFIHYGRLLLKPNFIHNNFFRLLSTIIISESELNKDYFPLKMSQIINDIDELKERIQNENISIENIGDSLISIKYIDKPRVIHLYTPPLTIEELLLVLNNQ